MVRSRTLRVSQPIDVAASLALIGNGKHDPTRRAANGCSAKALQTPVGPAALMLEWSGAEIRGSAWGAGADWTLERLSAYVGAEDDPSAFAPHDARIQALLQRHSGLRLPTVPVRFDLLVSYVLQQRVRWVEAIESYRLLVQQHCAPAPGPLPLRLPPTPPLVLGLSMGELGALGIDRQRARALQHVAAVARHVEEAPSSELRRLLLSIPGIGPWTSEMCLGIGLGDADAVPLGDYSLPHMVAWALSGKPRSDDEEMQRLLEPFRGQRFRLLRLLYAANAYAPRFGPRRPRRRAGS